MNVQGAARPLFPSESTAGSLRAGLPHGPLPGWSAWSGGLDLRDCGPSQPTSGEGLGQPEDFPRAAPGGGVLTGPHTQGVHPSMDIGQPRGPFSMSKKLFFMPKSPLAHDNLLVERTRLYFRAQPRTSSLVPPHVPTCLLHPPPRPPSGLSGPRGGTRGAVQPPSPHWGPLRRQSPGAPPPLGRLLSWTTPFSTIPQRWLPTTTQCPGVECIWPRLRLKRLPSLTVLDGEQATSTLRDLSAPHSSSSMGQGARRILVPHPNLGPSGGHFKILGPVCFL